MKKLDTRHQENKFFATTLEEMKGMYTAKRLLRSWFEDFIDEDTGETVPIERHEIILNMGVLLDDYALQVVHFHLSSGDIKEVEVSDQKREGIFSENYSTSTWCVTATILGKKKNIYLYANSVFVALEIATDFIEQQYVGHFGIIGVKELNAAILITNISQETDGELKFHNIEVEIEKDEHSYCNVFIVKALNAENGKALIEAFLKNKFLSENEDDEFQLILLSAKVIPCEAVIDTAFSSKYLEEQKSDGKAH